MSPVPDLGRRVGATTQVLSLLAFTTTGALVSWFAEQARSADALKAPKTQPTRVVVPVPVERPLRKVVVRRVVAADATPGARASSGRAQAAPAPKRRSRPATEGPSASSGPRQSSQPAPAPAQQAAVTSSSGS